MDVGEALENVARFRFALREQVCSRLVVARALTVSKRELVRASPGQGCARAYAWPCPVRGSPWGWLAGAGTVGG